MKLELRNLDAPTGTRTFPKALLELYEAGPMTIGRTTHQPGWKWSEDIGAPNGERWCGVEHVGLVLSGRAAILMEDGERQETRPGDFFHIPPGHDSWVVGDEPYVCLHVMGHV